MMRRFEGWEGILDAEIEKARPLPFEWGSHDCATWAANVVLALTGEDVINSLRGTYANQEGAFRVIEETGGTLDGCVDVRLPRVAVPFARRGDVVRWGHSLGICVGFYSFFITEQNGLQPIKTRHCEAAWRVG